MHEANAICVSCAQPLTGRFCSNCGEQALDRTALTVRHFISHTLVHEVFHLDGKIWRTLRALLFRPGFLSLEYCAGRRRPYINPVRLLITAIIVYAIATRGSGLLVSLQLYTVTLSVAPTKIAKGLTVAETVERLDRGGVLKPLMDAKARSMDIESESVRDAFHRKLENFAEPLSFANVFLLSLMLYLCFRRTRPLLLEHGVFSMHVISFVLFSSLPLVPTMWILERSEFVALLIILAVVLWQFVYLGVAIRRFYLNQRPGRIPRGLVAAATAMLVYIVNSVFLTGVQMLGAALALWTL